MDGMRHGFGRMIYHHGKCAIGFFKTDVRHGNSYEIKPNGSISHTYTGWFENSLKRGALRDAEPH